MLVQPGGNSVKQPQNPNLGVSLDIIRNRHASLTLSLGTYDAKPMAGLIFHESGSREKKMDRIEEEANKSIAQAQTNLRECCDTILAPYKPVLQTPAITLFVRGINQKQEENQLQLTTYKTEIKQKLIREFEALEQTVSETKSSWVNWRTFIGLGTQSVAESKRGRSQSPAKNEEA